jgi:hypothetical protein
MKRENGVTPRVGPGHPGGVEQSGLSTKNFEPSGEWGIVTPETAIFAQSISTRARSSSLDRKMILLRRNDKPNSDVLLERVGTLLTENVEGVRIVKAWEVMPGSDVAQPGVDTLKEIAALKPDLVISAQGD